MFDVLFQNATIIDGTGAPRYTGSIGVKDGLIHPAPADSPARRVIDARGKILSPGFIDPHSHGDMIVGNDFAREAKTTQGITTEVAGMCGATFFPFLPGPKGNEMVSKTDPENLRAAKDTFTSGEAFFRFVEQAEKSCNMTLFTGHNALRVAVMGYSDQKPTPEQLERMKDLLRETMEHGSQGLSTGLFYPPSGYADVDEVAQLCKVVAEYGGIHTSHIRDEASRILPSIEEILEVARRSGVRSNISHHKVCGKDMWGASEKTLALIDQANSQGLDVTLDQYPYTASCTSLSACLPLYCSADGKEALIQNLRDPAYRQVVKGQMDGDDPAFDGRYRQCGGFENIMIGIAHHTREAEGLTVAEIARRQGKADFDAFFDLLVDNELGCFAIYFSMCDEDLFRIIQHPRCMVGTDGIVSSLHGPTHPRGWAAFPRAIRLFVRENHLFTLEQMIHKITQQPAQVYGLKDRGVIAQGQAADLVLFDEAGIRDMADYAKSSERCAGIDLVMVNGQIVLENGEMTGVYPGRFLPAR